jgi:hypothetical protein
MSEVKPLHGYVCPICRNVYDKEEEAVKCINGHVELSYDPTFSMSGLYPVNIRAWKVVGGSPVEWRDYSPEGEPHVVKK